VRFFLGQSASLLPVLGSTTVSTRREKGGALEAREGRAPSPVRRQACLSSLLRFKERASLSPKKREEKKKKVLSCI